MGREINGMSDCWRNTLGSIPMPSSSVVFTLVSIGLTGPNRLGVTLLLSILIAIRHSPNLWVKISGEIASLRDPKKIRFTSRSGVPAKIWSAHEHPKLYKPQHTPVPQQSSNYCGRILVQPPIPCFAEWHKLLTLVLTTFFLIVLVVLTASPLGLTHLTLPMM